MSDLDYTEITLDMPTDWVRIERSREIASRIKEQMNTMLKRQPSSFISKVMSELMQSDDDMATIIGNRKMRGLMEKLFSSSSADDIQFGANEKMHELMETDFNPSLISEKKFSSSSVDQDAPFSGNTVRIMYYELYQAVRDKNADADKFVSVLEQVCLLNGVDLAAIFNQVTPTGDSLLHAAAECGNEEVVRLIAFHYPKLLCKTNLKGDTPLHVAARAKNIFAIKSILNTYKHEMISEEDESKDKAEFIMSRNNYGRTALHEAVLSKDLSVVFFLLLSHSQSDLAAYWTWNSSYGCKSPMYLAVLTGTKDILHLLLKKIPIPSGRAISNGDSPLQAAISERNNALLKKIVDTREELMHQRDEKNNTPLHYAAYMGYLGGVCTMLEKSPTIAFQRNSDGNLPIHLACKKGHVQVVNKLLETEWSNAGVFLNSKGQNILHIAAMKGQTDMIKYLLKNPKIHHDTLNERDVNGDTPLHFASRKLSLWTLLLLSRHNMIKVNLVNNEGLTARDVVRMQCKIPMTRQELGTSFPDKIIYIFLADAILESAGVPLKANMLGISRTTSTNKEWNVKDAANTLMLVAILIATVTFTAGFTVPGGFYSSDDPLAKQRGMALLVDQKLFNIFMAFNTIAMYSSTIGSVVLLWVPLGDLRFAEGAYELAKIFVYVALVTMPAAFLAAIRLVVSNNTLLADVISVIGFASIFIILFARILGRFPLRTRLPFFRQIGDFFIRIILVSFYGWSDLLIGDQVSQANQVGQASQVNETFAIDIDDDNGDAASSHFSDTNVHRLCPCF
ncbi:protein ACCELERATED CELL DEATH 6-like [Prosopis cineraria]|uniref:protein ACCELERATED CELL DEATH 6-like n=1 Tax=Prosopis cineraria TaxID=364024 RepID=UPI0024103BC3|nr:protein ACCELERATED CELL DEATH 6-like [Prosopis cineraria]